MDPSLDEHTKKALSKLLTNNADMFATLDVDLKYPTTLKKIHIDPGDHKPIALKPQRIPIAGIKWLDEQIDKFLKGEIIRHSISPLISLLVLLNSKECGLRFCIDLKN